MSVLPTLFRESAVVVEAPIMLVDDQLWDAELAYIRHAVPKRRAEFGTARVCARRGLAELGLPPVAFVPGADRALVWPEGVVGSISHTHDYAAVVLHRSPPMQSVGLDVEALRAVEEQTCAMILTPRERSCLAARGLESRNVLALLIFSAKEAYFKCQYPLSTTFLDFQEVEIEVDLTRNEFAARARKVVPASVECLVGKFAFDAGRVFCGIEMTS